jgi:hypothetical protein
MTPPRLPAARAAALAGLLAGLGLAAAARGADTVILKDGFVIQGTPRKELTTITDPATGKAFQIAKDGALDMIDEGPKLVIFSKQARQPGEVGPDVSLRPEYRAYKMTFAGQKRNDPLPAGAVLDPARSTDFDARWVRTLHVTIGAAFDKLEQQITYLDPYTCYMVSPTHSWRIGYRTNEMDPAKVRKLLSTHPDLKEADGKPDAGKRVAVAKFMLDAGWVGAAKEDVEKVRAAFPDGAMPPAAKEAFDRLVREVDAAVAAAVVKEAAAALDAGRYRYGAEVLGVFPKETADPRQTDEASKLTARLKATREQYDAGRRLLRAVLDEATGLGRANPLVAAAGGAAAPAVPPKPLAGPLATLVPAAEYVYAELHPDSAHRVEFFVTLAAQAEREARQGRDPSKTPAELLATAVSGWVRGRTGSTPDPDRALGLWAAREAVLAYQRSDDANRRNEVLAAYRRGKPIPIDELAQVISLLPPAEPENLAARAGTPVNGAGVPPGVYRRKSAPCSLELGGVEYVVRLPPEYHHGRAYPVIVALTQPGLDPEQMLGSLALDADKGGYILVAPAWAGQFAKNRGWDWDGAKHEYVTAVLRDAVRHFCVDNGRVFLFGMGDGASMALDVGTSHPDLFAGVLAMGPAPRWLNGLESYWRNAQKLPIYTCVGEHAGPAVGQLRLAYEKWTRYGFPAVMTIYKGRGPEWFAAEVPVMFEWMARKKRVPGTAVLQLDTQNRVRWTTFRATDDRFYWLGVDEISRLRLLENVKPGGRVLPAEIQGDIDGNRVTVSTLGVTKLSVWLSQDMIDWTKPVKVSVNARDAPDWKPRVLEPDLGVLLEDYRQRGDRRMLFLQRLELKALP